MCCHGGEHRGPCQTCGTPTRVGAGHRGPQAQLCQLCLSCPSPAILPPPLRCFPHSWGAGRWLLSPSCTAAPGALFAPSSSVNPTQWWGEMIQPWCNITFQLTLLSLQNNLLIDLFALSWSQALTQASLCLVLIADKVFRPSYTGKFISKLNLSCK